MPAADVNGFEFNVEQPVNKPWYLSLHKVYKAIKKTVSSIPYSNALFDKFIDGISALTQLINTKTGSNIVIIDHEKANELIAFMDGFVGDQLIMTDYLFDRLRNKQA